MVNAAVGKLLDGKVALVTGAGNGIGRATARLFARHGAAIGAVDIAGDLAQEVAAEIQASGGRAVAIRADVASEVDVATAVATVARAFGGLNILINNAGVPSGDNVPIEDMPLERWDRSMNVNLRAHLMLAKAAFPWLSRHGGAVVGTASSGGMTGLPMAADYGTSKAAVIMLTRQLAAEWGKHGIRVNCVSPGVVSTGFGSPRAPGEERPPVDPAFRAQREQWIPLGRLGEAEEIAKVMLFLASDLASYVTGANVVVDGGELTNVKNALRGEVV
jgi:NAD(P)-dependent dehydrogenase (short-subunit alcohol dehydrogenase family)